MSKKKIVPKTLNIYGNIILNTDSDLVSGIVICDINDINLNINITNSNEGNYSISIPEKDIGYGDNITITLELYDHDNNMYKIGDEVQFVTNLDISPDIMINFLVNEDNKVYGQ